MGAKIYNCLNPSLPTVVIVDYGMGNLWSVQSAFAYLGVECRITKDPSLISEANALVLPGVGSFRRAMQALEDRGLIEPLKTAVAVRKRKILGICLGFQMMTLASTEDGETSGLGFISGITERFTQNDLKGKKIPHIGFNSVSFDESNKFFFGLKSPADFYFVHSYRLLPSGIKGSLATCSHGVSFVAAYQYENIFGAQFHPEKSQTNGLKILKNFLET